VSLTITSKLEISHHSPFWLGASSHKPSPSTANMHELFLSTQVANEDLQRALRILQGYCGMKPVTLIRRRLMWEGPRTRSLQGIDPKFLQRQQPVKEPFWRSLHEQLIRQSYIITLIYDVDRDQFGRVENTKSSDGEDIDSTKKDDM